MGTRSRARRSVVRLGKQPPRYRFFLNPYTDARFMKCPQCLAKTRQRKLPLVIHIEPLQLVALNKTCRYCPHCDLLDRPSGPARGVAGRVIHGAPA